jgi:hypothetical protein
LQLNNTIASASYLSTPSPATSIDNTEWSFYIHQAFAPSSSNYGRVYLVSDSQNLQGTLNGYYLQFGETGSLDAAQLFRQAGAASTSVCRGTNSQIAAAFTISVKVTRDASGNWTLSVDPLAGTSYVIEASGTDNTFTTTNYFGVSCVYTISNATNFYFDNFFNGAIIVDVTPPAITSSTVMTTTQVDVVYSEAVDSTTSSSIINYSADNGLGNPTSALRDTLNTSLVHLTFATAFVNGVLYTLTISNINDFAANTMITGNTTFSKYTANAFDIVINEIMADPDPPVGLPNYEYVELYNRTAYSINLAGWGLSTTTSHCILPNVTILADSFIVFTSVTGGPLFPASANVMGVTSFPGITNTGQTLTLTNPQGNIISTVSYTDAWYQDATKASGGWSIEQIDPNNPCTGISNWRASVNPLGGTPGMQNSVNAPNPDHAPPQLLRVSIISKDTIQLYFSEPLDSLTMLNDSVYSIDNGIGIPINTKAIAPDFLSVLLTLADTLHHGIIYTITAINTITDCVGNHLGVPNTARFALPDKAMPNDIVINEILYDPNTGGVDFVEIYNRSSKIIDLKTITISQFDTINNVQTSIKTITSNGYLIFPNDYLVLSADGNSVKSQYKTTNPNGFLDIPSMISMNIAGGTVCLATLTDIIDNFIYYDNMQFALLSVTKGISLERVDFNRQTQDRSNWHSAAEAVGFATPGYQNSQYNDAGTTDDAIEITPEIFSPDEDGYNDILNINYHFDTPGFVANVNVYDSNGRLERRLIHNQLLGINGTFSWDGINDEREKSRIGIYIIYLEVFNLTGSVKHYKKTCVLASKL